MYCNTAVKLIFIYCFPIPCLGDKTAQMLKCLSFLRCLQRHPGHPICTFCLQIDLCLTVQSVQSAPIINCSGSCPCYKLGLLQQPPIRTPRLWDTGPRSRVKHYHGEEIEAEERKVLYQALSETIKLSDKGPALPSSDCLSLYYTLLSLRCIIKLYLERRQKECARNTNQPAQRQN